MEDVSTKDLARVADLGDWPGFDLRSWHPDGQQRVEVKGRARIGDIELSLVRAKGGVVIDQRAIFDAAEPPELREPTTEPLPDRSSPRAGRFT